jgi:hypothetical protein
MYYFTFKIAPVMWEINGKWISTSPEQRNSEIIPQKMTPLRHHFESQLELSSIGDGLYSRQAMTAYEKLLANKTINLV